MTRKAYLACRTVLSAAGLLWAATAGAQTSSTPPPATILTADAAVQLALQNSAQAINAEADVLSARSGVYGAYSGVLPRVSASLSRSGRWADNSRGSAVGDVGLVVPTIASDQESYSTTPAVTGSWSIFDLSAISGLSAAKSGLAAAQLSRSAARNDVVLATRRQFYEVVRAEHLSRVANAALRLARDDERRVRALFQVGSVSRSDVLSAQVRTAQSELDSLTARQLIINQRIALASQVGVREAEMPPIDTTLTASIQTWDAAALLAEAEKHRPDLAAADKELRAAELGLRSANFGRWPYVTLNGGLNYKPRSSSVVTLFPPPDSLGNPRPSFDQPSRSESDLNYFATVALNLDIFNGMQTESQIASARARLVRAEQARDALRRNLRSEIDQVLLAYGEAVERERVSRRAFESAGENVRLTQQKYNVGSATILELIDAQLSYSRSAAEVISALATIRVADAAVERVRGRAY